MKTLSTVVLAILAVGVWWLQQDGDADRSDSGARPDSSASAQQSTGPSEPTRAASPTTEPESPSSSASDSSPESEGAQPDRPGTDEDGIPYVDVAALPPEARETLSLIDAGGPFPYEDKDGSTFGNFEGVLPDRERGYYAEYTVETPGLSHRGARRIVTGDGGEFYWTEDHYESFERIRR